jgi:hypothetical protein
MGSHFLARAAPGQVLQIAEEANACAETCLEVFGSVVGKPPHAPEVPLEAEGPIEPDSFALEPLGPRGVLLHDASRIWTLVGWWRGLGIPKQALSLFPHFLAEPVAPNGLGSHPVFYTESSLRFWTQIFSTTVSPLV